MSATPTSKHLHAPCLGCGGTDARIRLGGLYCHDCLEDGIDRVRGRSDLPEGREDAPSAHELAARHDDGLAVVLLWDPRDDAVTVSVADARTGDRFEVAVDRTHALDAFYHPYAYAA
jgi:hypothetical protein